MKSSMGLQSKELRIGNYIYEPNNENTNPFKVWSIYNEDGNDKLNGYPLSYCKPIPLTEEWLFKFGFKRDLQLEELEGEGFGGDFKHYYFGNRSTAHFIRICYHERGKYTLSYRDASLIKPKHVHQIQNLYFALTGEELTMN